MERRPEPEMVGATKAPHDLASEPTTAHFSVKPPSGPAASGSATNTYLKIENVTSTGPASGYEVYLNLPPGADPQQHPDHLVGMMPLFGVAEASRPSAQHPGSGLHFSLDATDVVRTLQAKKAWDPNDVQVTFVPRHPTRRRGAIKVGQISLYHA